MAKIFYSLLISFVFIINSKIYAQIQMPQDEISLFFDSLANKNEFIKNEISRRTLRSDTIFERKNYVIKYYPDDIDSIYFTYEYKNYKYKYGRRQNRKYPHSDEFSAYISVKSKNIPIDLESTDMILYYGSFEYHKLYFRYFRYFISSYNPWNCFYCKGYTFHIISPDWEIESFYFPDIPITISYGDANKDGYLDIIYGERFISSEEDRLKEKDTNNIYKIKILTYKNEKWQNLKDNQNREYSIFFLLKHTPDSIGDFHFGFKILEYYWIK